MKFRTPEALAATCRGTPVRRAWLERLPEIIREMLLTTHSERQGRLIDFDEEGSMETKKREGYF